MLFEEVVDVLDDSGIASANRRYSLAKPADGWGRARRRIALTFPSVRRSSSVSQSTIVVDLLHPDIVQLQKVDLISCEPP